MPQIDRSFDSCIRSPHGCPSHLFTKFTPSPGIVQHSLSTPGTCSTPGTFFYVICGCERTHPCFVFTPSFFSFVNSRGSNQQGNRTWCMEHRRHREFVRYLAFRGSTPRVRMSSTALFLFAHFKLFRSLSYRSEGCSSLDIYLVPSAVRGSTPRI